MRRTSYRRPPLLLAALVAGACASAPPADVPVPETGVAFAYRPVTAATYVFTDSAVFEMQFGNVSFAAAGTASIDLATVPEGIRLNARLVDFRGAFNGPTGASTADESGVKGPFQWTMSTSGQIIDKKLPEMTDDFEQISRSGDPLRSLVIPLPRTPILRGASWTDTIVVRESGETSVDNRAVVTSTWTGDSLVAGRTLRVIRSTMDNDLNITASTGGMTVSQKLKGSTRATTLWDPDRGLPVERVSTSDLSGTLDVAEAGMSGIPVKARLTSRLRMQ